MKKDVIVCDVVIVGLHKEGSDTLIGGIDELSNDLITI